MSEHDRFADTAGAYVLGALPDEERSAYAAHLATCTACQAEVEELNLAAAALPMAAPPMKPPPALKARIMAEVEREAALLASAGEPRREVKPRRRRRWNLPMGAVAALACTALLAGVLGGALLFGGGGSTVPFEVERSLQAASAELEVDGDKAILVASNLPAPPEGRYYMVWLVEDGTPKPTSALFTPRGDGSATASVTGVEDAEAVVVNTESSPDVTAPTSDVLMTATLT
jgi:anti-sigma factor RsiW